MKASPDYCFRRSQAAQGNERNINIAEPGSACMWAGRPRPRRHFSRLDSNLLTLSLVHMLLLSSKVPYVLLKGRRHGNTLAMYIARRDVPAERREYEPEFSLITSLPLHQSSVPLTAVPDSLEPRATPNCAEQVHILRPTIYIFVR